MSSQSQNELEAELVAILQPYFVTNYAQVAAAALLAYELVLTLDEAVHSIRRWKSPTVLMFLTNQCVILCLVVINVLGMLPLTTNAASSCQAVGIIYDILQLVTFLEWAAISAVRIRVVSRERWIRWILSIIVLVLDLVPFATTMYTSVLTSYETLTVQHTITFCQPVIRFTNESNNIALVASRSCAIVADIFVVVMTWFYSRGPELMPQVLGFKGQIRLPALLLRNALLLISAAQIIMTFVATLSVGTVFLIPVMAILVSRFLLSVRKAADEARGPNDTLCTTLDGTESTVSFELQITDSTSMGTIPYLEPQTLCAREGSSTGVGRYATTDRAMVASVRGKEGV
ncbi:hypothetical protein C8Q72DRAFT_863278 [Fomitopsis betulina]|nr:hypothetical protein C8Q72DRAFT_863278 [Fomitopsis betulina]